MRRSMRRMVDGDSKYGPVAIRRNHWCPTPRMLRRLVLPATRRKNPKTSRFQLTFPEIGFDVRFPWHRKLCAPNKSGQCGRLLKARRGEVAERLNAAVC